MLVPYKVLLPKRLFQENKIDEELMDLVLDYMERYPHYHIVSIENGFAICERKVKEGGNIERS